MTLLWSIKIATTNCFPWAIEGRRRLRGSSENCSAQDLHFAKGSTYKPQHTNAHTEAHTHVQAISHNYHVHAMGPLGTKGNREPTNGPGGGTKHDQLDHMFCKKAGGVGVDRGFQLPRNSIGPLG